MPWLSPLLLLLVLFPFPVVFREKSISRRTEARKPTLPQLLTANPALTAVACARKLLAALLQNRPCASRAVFVCVLIVSFRTANEMSVIRNPVGLHAGEERWFLMQADKPAGFLLSQE